MKLLSDLAPIAALLLGLAPGMLCARTLDLRLTPDPEAPVVGQIEAESASAAASPVLDRDRAEAGWKWTELTGTWQGYLPDSALSKNFDVEPGATIRAEPSPTAAALGTAAEDDRFEIIESTDGWTTVRFRKTVPVYFQSSTEIADAPAVNAPAPAPKETRPRSGPRASIDPDAEVARVEPDALPPENVVWSTRTSRPAAEPAEPAPDETVELAPAERSGELEPIDIVVPPVQTQARDTPIRPQAAAGTPTRRLSGTLVRKISNFGPAYPLRLRADNGRRLAYVDMTQLFITNLHPYLDQKVIIQGEIRPVAPGSKDIVIQAQSIRTLD
ncbi:MAG: hypothetical protein ACLFVC_03095 [Opitutales bacterium]